MRGHGLVRATARDLWLERRDVAGSVVCRLAENGLLLALPVLAGRVVTGVQAGQSPTPIIAAMAGCVAVLIILRHVGGYVGARAQERTIRKLRYRIFERILALPPSATSDRRSGELAAILGTRSESIAHFVSFAAIALVPSLLTVVGALWMVARIDLPLAACAAAGIAITMLAVRLFGRRIRPALHSGALLAAEAEGMVEEALTHLPAIQSYAREPRDLQRHGAFLDRLLGARLGEQRAVAWLSTLSVSLMSAAALVVLVAALNGLAAGTLEPTGLVSAFLLTLVLLGPAGSLAHLYSLSSRAQLSAHEIDVALGEMPAERGATAELVPGPGRVEVTDVSFAYPGRPPVLTGLTASFPAGTLTAVIGLNGAGKSTLFRLIQRFLIADAGTITIDAQDVADVDPRELRKQLAVVFQDDPLIHGTIADNINFGPVPASTDDVHAASELAGLHPFVGGLADGYDTFIGADGIALSGGQRKRLQMARALVHKPRIYLLDEPTAMLDESARRDIAQLINGSLRGTTVIVATHDRDLIELADQVIEIRDGVAAVKGTSEARLAVVKP